MNVIRKILPFLHLVNIGYQLVIRNSTTWLEDQVGADQLYSPSILTKKASSLVICLACCSDIETSNAAIYSNGSGTCHCLETKQSMTSQPGHRLWNRKIEDSSLSLRTPDGMISLATQQWRFKVYTGILELKTHTEANSFCGTLGGRLAVLDTEEKLNAVTSLPDYKSWIHIHVGATDLETEGVYLWSTGTALTSSNWVLGQPDIFRKYSDCIALINGKFDDIICTYKTGFVCESLH